MRLSGMNNPDDEAERDQEILTAYDRIRDEHGAGCTCRYCCHE